MKIIEDINNIILKEPTAVTIGKFDGFHLGHEKITERLLSYKNRGLKTCVVTFKESPQSVIEGKSDYKVITTKAEKRRIFEELGFDYYVELPFDESIRCLGAGDFVEDILIKSLKMEACVAGVDIRFGYKGLGNAELLNELGKKHGFETQIIEKVMFEGEVVSSTLIRKLIEEGNLKKASKMLSVSYHIFGQVVHGREIGRTISMPTVNLIPEEEKLLPPFGVYVSETEYEGKRYRSVTNLGCKPTIEGEKPKVGVETYLFDFDKQTYGDYINVALFERIRGEKKFDSIEALKEQMEKDVLFTENYYVNRGTI